MVIRSDFHLINLIKQEVEARKDINKDGKYALFLGAGASATSGVKLATQMINELREMWTRNHTRSCRDRKNGQRPLQLLRKNSWYDSDEEYGALFEEVFDHPSQRQMYVEACIKDALPSIGYLYLVSLLECGIFNTVLTTNFDDLINEACIRHGNRIKPDVWTPEMGLARARPSYPRVSIAKLHGDYRSRSIKNTASECSSISDSARTYIERVAVDCGLIVVGFSGVDSAVFDELKALLGARKFEHGLYWCVRRERKTPQRVRALQRYEQFRLVEIDGFDEFLATMCHELDLGLPEALTSPHSSFATLLNRFASCVESASQHPIISRDIQRVRESVVKCSPRQARIAIDCDDRQVVAPVPFHFLAETSLREGQLDDAWSLVRRALDVEPSMPALGLALRICERSCWPKDRVVQFVDSIRKSIACITEQPQWLHDVAIRMINGRQYEMAEVVLEVGRDAFVVSGTRETRIAFHMDFYWLNRAQISRHQGRSLDEEVRREVEKLLAVDEPLTRAGALVVLGRHEEATNELDRVSSRQRDMFLGWPIGGLMLRERIGGAEGARESANACN